MPPRRAPVPYKPNDSEIADLFVGVVEGFRSSLWSLGVAPANAPVPAPPLRPIAIDSSSKPRGGYGGLGVWAQLDSLGLLPFEQSFEVNAPFSATTITSVKETKVSATATSKVGSELRAFASDGESDEDMRETRSTRGTAKQTRTTSETSERDAPVAEAPYGLAKSPFSPRARRKAPPAASSIAIDISSIASNSRPAALARSRSNLSLGEGSASPAQSESSSRQSPGGQHTLLSHSSRAHSSSAYHSSHQAGQSSRPESPGSSETSPRTPPPALSFAQRSGAEATTLTSRSQRSGASPLGSVGESTARSYSNRTGNASMAGVETTTVTSQTQRTALSSRQVVDSRTVRSKQRSHSSPSSPRSPRSQQKQQRFRHSDPFSAMMRRDALRSFFEESYGTVARGFDAMTKLVGAKSQLPERLSYAFNEADFKNTLTDLGYGLDATPAWWQELFEAVDVDRDGLVSLQDLCDSLVLGT
eukprot:TRINITY_DN26452_c0_g1_i1.p1 TRINITY_DN26452_c0_g1~~TRINITY_DN26452_c0_g1_i1.p1  ORF type:complete len:474 (-),score=79.36 TRINITY_DN26452_c0_g1_i1:182-1603(-)